jgi:hypothetical protein
MQTGEVAMLQQMESATKRGVAQQKVLVKNPSLLFALLRIIEKQHFLTAQGLITMLRA